MIRGDLTGKRKVLRPIAYQLTNKDTLDLMARLFLPFRKPHYPEDRQALAAKTDPYDPAGMHKHPDPHERTDTVEAFFGTWKGAIELIKNHHYDGKFDHNDFRFA